MEQAGHAERDVRLVRLPVAVARGLLAGTLPGPRAWHPEFPSADTVSAARMLLGAYEALGLEPDDGMAWWFFGIVVDGLVVGDAGFHGPPAAERPFEVEIGYQVVPASRGRGIATQACGLLLQHAWRSGADVVRAQVEPGNPHGAASAAVLRANGFRSTAPGDFTLTPPVAASA